MKTIFKLILISFLFLKCFDSFAQTEINNDKVMSFPSSFTLEVVCPLTINIAPIGGIIGPRGYEYTRPTNGNTDYPIVAPGGSTAAGHSFDIVGSTGKYFYYKITDSNGEIVTIFTDNGVQGCSKISDGKGVTLKVVWGVIEWGLPDNEYMNDFLSATPPDGQSWTNGKRRAQLSEHKSGWTEDQTISRCEGQYTIQCILNSLNIESDAELGLHQFSHTISACYNTF